MLKMATLSAYGELYSAAPKQRFGWMLFEADTVYNRLSQFQHDAMTRQSEFIKTGMQLWSQRFLS